jgi:hypothetical protein
MYSQNEINKALASAKSAYEKDYADCQKTQQLLAEALTAVMHIVGVLPDFDYQISSRGAIIKNVGAKLFIMQMDVHSSTAIENAVIRTISFIRAEENQEGAKPEQISFLEKLLCTDLRFQIKIVQKNNSTCHGYVEFTPI